MSFFAVMFALLIEQLKPLPRDNWIHETLVVVGALDRPELRRRAAAPRLGRVGRVGAARRWSLVAALYLAGRRISACCWRWPSTSRCST